MKRSFRALAALPLVIAMAACEFNPAGKPYTAGVQNGGIRCDIERERRCATAEDLSIGIDVARPFEDGFWPQRSSPIGLDRSPAARARCGGQPEAVVFRCPFPDGCRECVNCSTIGEPGSHYADPTAACVDYCHAQGWGSPAQCLDRARASAGSPPSCFGGACTNGCPNPGWSDPRRVTPTPTPFPTPTPMLPNPVVWRDEVNVLATGSSLRKTSAAEAWDAGATSTRLLLSGNGWVEFVVTENTHRRMCGLSIGGHPDTDPSSTDIDFAVYMRADGMLAIYESGQSPIMGLPTPYAPGDRIRIAVTGAAVKLVRYSRNGVVFHESAVPVAYPLRVDTSFYDQDATITDARTSF